MMYPAIKLIYLEPTFSLLCVYSPLRPAGVLSSVLRGRQPFPALKLPGKMFPIIISTLLADLGYSLRCPDKKKLRPVNPAENHLIHTGNAEKLFIKLLQGTSSQLHLLRHFFQRPLPFRILVNLFPQG